MKTLEQFVTKLMEKVPGEWVVNHGEGDYSEKPWTKCTPELMEEINAVEAAWLIRKPTTAGEKREWVMLLPYERPSVFGDKVCDYTVGLEQAISEIESEGVS